MHPDTTTITAPPGEDTPPVAARRVGHLYPQVAAHLAANPGQLLKVGEITRAIGAPSPGAVHEALKRMAAAGYAIHHADPHRFEVTPAGIANAGTLPPPVPRPAGTAAGRGGRRQPLTRPNGELYFPRH